MGRDERSNLRGMPGGLPIIGGGNRTALLPPEVRDHAGRVLNEGDGVILQTPIHQVFRVMKIAAVLEPGVPAGLMDITLLCQARFRAPRGQPNQEFLRVVENMERRPQQPTPAEAIQDDPDAEARDEEPPA